MPQKKIGKSQKYLLINQAFIRTSTRRMIRAPTDTITT